MLRSRRPAAAGEVRRDAVRPTHRERLGDPHVMEASRFNRAWHAGQTVIRRSGSLLPVGDGGHRGRWRRAPRSGSGSDRRRARGTSATPHKRRVARNARFSLSAGTDVPRSTLMRPPRIAGTRSILAKKSGARHHVPIAIRITTPFASRNMIHKCRSKNRPVNAP